MESSIERIYPIFLEHPVVSTDSRHIQPGSLFFALKGDSFNGNEFASLALERGASYAIVDDPGCATHERTLVVNDVLLTLQQLAHHHRMRFNIPVIAITGTNGKTTTKELMQAVLSQSFKTLATEGNLNNHIGVPLTLLKLTDRTEIAVIEMGANHRGEIDFLCQIAKPDHGLITNIGRAHLEGFGGFDGVVATKTELYRFLLGSEGVAFLNINDTLLKEKASGLRVVTYGDPPADVETISIEADPMVSVTLDFKEKKGVVIQSSLYGRYNADNIRAAACVGQFFGVPAGLIKSAIEIYQPTNNRSQVMQSGHNLLILDAYNANPSSMEAALKAFSEASYPAKTAILGDMLELGAESDEEHLKILQLLHDINLDQVYLVGPRFTRLNTTREFICFTDAALASLWLLHHKLENATILIKGSRGIKLEKLIETL
jgi:UDP-N-acetylmuramoyl-tripeptide--D-alanyl-D-alanine ligase